MRVLFGLARLSMFCLLVAGCATSIQYVVLAGVPDSPTITVIPSSGTRDDAIASDLVTGWVVGCGVRTIARPVMLKEQADYSGATTGSSIAAMGGQVGVAVGAGRTQAGLTTSVDAMSLIDSTAADYVIFVRSLRGGPQIMLLKRDSKQILHVGQLLAANDDKGAYAPSIEQLHRVLLTAGIRSRPPLGRGSVHPPEQDNSEDE